MRWVCAAVPIYASGQSGTLFQLRGVVRAEQGTAADAFQRPLRFRFRARLNAGVSQKRKLTAPARLPSFPHASYRSFDTS